MKKSPLLIATLAILFAAVWPSGLRAQFFKQLVNTVKNTAQNRANSKADNTTNKALDKVDSLGHGTNGTSTTGATATGGSTSTTALSPGSTASGTSVSGTPASGSTPDISKALGLMVGGGGVSAADSAAAIKSFTTASGGDGMFYQYQMTLVSKKSGTTKDTSSLYLTNSGNGRSEMQLPIPGMKSDPMVIIGRAGKPTYSLSLYANEKSYSLNVIDTSLLNFKENYQVQKIGNETVNGYSCVHVKLTSTVGSGIFKSSSSEDIWTSTSVPGYSMYRRLMISQNLKPQMMAALENAGAGGFLVRMASSGKDYSMDMSLIRADEKNLPSSMFVIPSGYTQSDGNMISHMMTGAMQAQKK